MAVDVEKRRKRKNVATPVGGHNTAEKVAHMEQNSSQVEYVRCEDLFREVDPGFAAEGMCNKLREVASGSELVRLKHAALNMLRRCKDTKDEVACKFFRKLQNAPAWRVESLIKEYTQYLKYLDCMRNYDDEKTCKRYLPSRSEKGQDAEKQDIEENLRKLPVEYVVEEEEIIVKVGKGEKLSDSQFRATISELKKMGFMFDSDTKLWRRSV